jgi:hypothetical protein
VQLKLCGRTLGSVVMVLAASIAGCHRTPEATAIPATSQLIVDSPHLSLVAGANGRVAARALDVAGNPISGAHLHFSASDPRLLRVDAQGAVSSLGPAGRASILIASGTRSVTVPVDVAAGPARKLEAVGKSDITIVAGMAPKEPVSVRLVDAFDNPIANARVMFETDMSPALSLSTITSSDGVASVTLPVVIRSGHFIVSAHVASNASVSLPLDIQVNPGPPTTLDAVRVLPSGPVALVPHFELVLQVRDAFGNPVPNALVRWRTYSGSASFDPPQSLSGLDGLVRTRWQLTKLKGRRATLRAFVAGHEAISFQTWIALER